ncbi:serine protease [Streptomyces sp. NPDC000594]|uniref:S1 family peptidase n=1 Tax=Streptomyces sp. NPDC000594 TaxID=3154261 RepID=UPI0033267B91
MNLGAFRGRSGRIAAAGVASAAAVAVLAAAAPALAGPPTPSAEPRTVQPKGPGAPIIGGSAVPNDKYPFQAALLFKGKGSPVDRQFCGGSLVDAFTVMTAAHCVDGGDPKEIEVTVGRTVLSNTKQGKLRNVVDTVVHPRYGKNGAYDLAFVYLEKPVTGIAPIGLPTVGTDALIKPGVKATVTGWGNTDTVLPNFPNRLREVKVPILSHEECEISTGGFTKGIDLCAGVQGKDSCQGDSGGPLFRNINGRENAIQVGIVSRGEGCAAQGAPGIYVSLSSAKLWKTLYESPEGKKIAKRLGR